MEHYVTVCMATLYIKDKKKRDKYCQSKFYDQVDEHSKFLKVFLKALLTTN